MALGLKERISNFWAWQLKSHRPFIPQPRNFLCSRKPVSFTPLQVLALCVFNKTKRSLVNDISWFCDFFCDKKPLNELRGQFRLKVLSHLKPIYNRFLHLRTVFSFSRSHVLCFQLYQLSKTGKDLFSVSAIYPISGFQVKGLNDFPPCDFHLILSYK